MHVKLCLAEGGSMATCSSQNHNNKPKNCQGEHGLLEVRLLDVLLHPHGGDHALRLVVPVRLWGSAVGTGLSKA